MTFAEVKRKLYSAAFANGYDIEKLKKIKIKDFPYIRGLEEKEERLLSEAEVRAIEAERKNRTAEDILRLHYEGQWRIH